MAQECSPRLRIAISGGGIAGASLFHALLKQPGVDVHIFESAPEFREAGAAVGLTRNAQSALELIGPSATDCLRRAGAVPQRGVHLLLAQGPNAGETVGQIGGEENVVAIVHRADFLRELLAGAPSERLHASKKLDSVDGVDVDGPLTLRFADRTTHECDVLIAADGIHSRVRKIVLGATDPAAIPVSAGWWLVQVLKPYAEVESVLSKSYFDMKSPGEVAWIGDGALIFHNILRKGQLGQFAIAVSCNAEDAPTDWQKLVATTEIRRIYAHWPTNLSKAVEKLVCDIPSQPAVYLWEHLPATTYVRGSIALLGDAAHATTPWQGSGAGMSIEDSMILSSLLRATKSLAEARVALRVYDSVRRARTQRVVESSKGIGRMSTAQDPETGLDAAKLREKLRHQWDFILDMDVAEHRERAMRQLESKLKT